MNEILGAGVVLSALGIGGYLVGIGTPYPGRAFAVTAMIIGVTLVAIGRANGFEEDEQ